MRLISSVLRDAQWAMRGLRRARGFTVVSTLLLALGIGVNTIAFSLIDVALFAPLPVRNSSELLFVYPADPKLVEIGHDHYLEATGRTELFAGIAATRRTATSVARGVDVERVLGELVSGSYFDVLGLIPTSGRLLMPADDGPSADPVVVISESLWRRQFNADPSIIGRTWDLRPVDRAFPYQIVGVVGGDFSGAVNPWERTEYWITLRRWDAALQQVLIHLYEPLAPRLLIARPQAGVTSERVQAFVSTWTGRGAAIVRQSREARLPFDAAGAGPTQLAAAAIVMTTLVLLICLSNLVGMVLARGVARERDLAVHVALGAGRAQVASQIGAEGLLLSVSGTALGVLLSRWAVPVGLSMASIRSGQASSMPINIPFDWRVLLFTSILCAATALVVALTSIRQAWTLSIVEALAGGKAGAFGGKTARLRHWVLLPQVSLSLALLVAGGEAAAQFIAVAMVAPGYEPEATMFAGVDILSTFSWKAGERDAYLRRLLEIARRSPSLDRVALASGLPVQPLIVGVTAREDFDAGISRAATRTVMTPGYLGALGIPLLLGRDFNDGDSADRPRVAIVSADFAAKAWPNDHPLGKQVTFSASGSANRNTSPPKWLDVVGVAGAVRAPLSEGQTMPVVYAPAWQDGFVDTLVARARGPQLEAGRALRAAVASADPRIGIVSSGTLRDVVDRARRPRSMTAWVLGLLGLAGALVACIGVYGIVAYAVSRRQRELGIRIALGAEARDIWRLVVGESARVAFIGLSLGLAGSIAAARIASTQLTQAIAVGPSVFAGASVVLILAIFVACYLPSRRAIRVDPVVVLREQ